MIFTPLNFIILFVLLAINLGFILTSKRKRRYGIFSSRIFQVLFVGYWLYLLIFLQIYSTPDTLPVAKRGKKATYDYAVEMKKRHSKEEFASTHLSILNYVIKGAGIQAMIVVGLCLIGVATVNNRNEYYWRTCIIHLLAWGFCIYVDMSELAI